MRSEGHRALKGAMGGSAPTRHCGFYRSDMVTVILRVEGGATLTFFWRPVRLPEAAVAAPRRVLLSTASVRGVRGASVAPGGRWGVGGGVGVVIGGLWL